MNCHHLRQRLLSATHPERVTRRLRAHLACCADCRAWRRRLLQIERHVPLLPVPPSRRKEAFLNRFVARENAMPAPATVRSGPETVPSLPAPAPAVVPSRRFQRPTLWQAAAASLAFTAGAGGLYWWIRPQLEDAAPPKLASDPLLASLLHRDLRLAEAGSPRERIEVLTDLADDLHRETRSLAQATATPQLTALARLYGQVIRDGILTQAEALPPPERAPFLDGIAGRFAAMAQAAEQWNGHVPDDCAAPIAAMVSAAQEGQRRLHDLARQEKS